jgi:hypothetical protein
MPGLLRAVEASGNGPAEARRFDVVSALYALLAVLDQVAETRP